MFESSSIGSPTVWRRVGLRFFFMSILWLGLTGGEWRSWLVGLPVVLVSTWLSLKLSPASYWRWGFKGLLPFCWYFTVQSILSGWDIALRALQTKCRIQPGTIPYALRLPPGPSQLFFCAIVSLLPGTLVTSIEDSTALVHVLDTSIEQEASLRELEERIAQLFALPGHSKRETL